MLMKILTWNINGIRSLPSNVKCQLDSLDVDVACFQETKIQREAVTPDIGLIDDYNSYFSFCRKRAGYSGVVTYCRDHATPMAAEEGLSNVYSNSNWTSSQIGCYGQKEEEEHVDADWLKSLDGEGRLVITKHEFRSTSRNASRGYLHIFNVYCPRFDADKPERGKFKMDFYRMLKTRIDAILTVPENHVLVAGDLNCSHKRIDHCEPDEDQDFEGNESRQFLNEWFYDEFEHPKGLMVDVFRTKYPNQRNAFTCWNTQLSARQTNYGTRIDYVLMDVGLYKMDVVSRVAHLPEVMGSDHCPVVVELDFSAIASEKVPDMCSKYFPQFKGTQQKLTSFFVKRSAEVTKVEATYSKKLKLESVETGSIRSFECIESSACADSGETSNSKIEEWKKIFKNSMSKKVAPNCAGHDEPCVLRTVKKKGPNMNRQFFCCARPQGAKDNKDARCSYFQWTP